MRTVPAGEALAAFRAAQTSGATKASGSTAIPFYEESCASQSLMPWPPSMETTELFAVFLRASEAYKAPVGY